MRIYRTVKLSKCYGQQVTDFGEFIDFYGELPGFVTPQKASKKFRKMFTNQSIVINKVEHYEDLYYMEVSDFLNYAKLKTTKQVNL